MKRVNYNGMQMNPSATIVDEVAAEIKDARCKIFAYDSNGKLALATDGSKPLVGIATIEVGVNDITGAESGKVNAGDDWMVHNIIDELSNLGECECDLTDAAVQLDLWILESNGYKNEAKELREMF